jgi:hypothetical protein
MLGIADRTVWFAGMMSVAKRVLDAHFSRVRCRLAGVTHMDVDSGEVLIQEGNGPEVTISMLKSQVMRYIHPKRADCGSIL